MLVEKDVETRRLEPNSAATRLSSCITSIVWQNFFLPELDNFQSGFVEIISFGLKNLYHT